MLSSLQRMNKGRDKAYSSSLLFVTASTNSGSIQAPVTVDCPHAEAEWNPSPLLWPLHQRYTICSTATGFVYSATIWTDICVGNRRPMPETSPALAAAGLAEAHMRRRGQGPHCFSACGCCGPDIRFQRTDVCGSVTAALRAVPEGC